MSLRFIPCDPGSSPRMRGTLIGCAGRIPSHGIIPAYAGNTKHGDDGCANDRDHPRVCGEHGQRYELRYAVQGSSPRMRGTPSGVVGFVYKAGIIPAYAGNTFSRFLGMPDGWDHPRVCGEHLTGNPYLLMVQGSSPRMRGTLGFSVTNTNDAGIIPAYAGNTWRPSSNLRCVRDHPRVCGEHEAFGTSASKAQGSSPRMRGTLVARIPEEIRGWIIPAYAGNTSLPKVFAMLTRDHPRVCGEHPIMIAVQVLSPGSSPRMRGTLGFAIVLPSIFGIIPAYAGNTCLRCCKTRKTRDHPRVCGEHSPCAVACASCLGSSPRMRGTLIKRVPSVLNIGIIPAYAGNTRLSVGVHGVLGDHPRVCGEHAIINGTLILSKGSSPRMRGTPENVSRGNLVQGIIPAYAGNTVAVPKCYVTIGDHPRVCGEHKAYFDRLDGIEGSSPRMRGTPQSLGHLRCVSGIIPAYAGNTRRETRCMALRRDHPRVCGEHMASQLRFALCSGSSPRMRGTHRYQGWRDDGEGIIPAYAGNTST